MKARRAMETAVIETTMAEVTVGEITVMKPLMTKVRAVGFKGVMIKECMTVMPVVSPVMPTPSKSSKVSDSKSDTERESNAAPKNSGHGIPARISEDRRAV